MTLTALVEKVNALGVKVYVREGRLKFLLPKEWLQTGKPNIPDEAKPVLREAVRRHEELARYLEAAARLFLYPLPETLGLGAVDPLDYRYEDGRVVFDPGWWRDIPRRRLH